MKTQINFRASQLTASQIEQLMGWWGTSQTETITVVVDRIYREEHAQREQTASDDGEFQSTTLTEEEMVALDDGQEWYKPGDYVVISGYVGGAQDTAHALQLEVNGKLHDNWTTFEELPAAIQARMLAGE